MSPRKKEEWIEVKEAAAIISEHSGREISPDYVRLIATKEGRIQWKPKDGRQNYYLKSDVEKIVVKQRRKRNTGESQETRQDGGSEKAA